MKIITSINYNDLEDFCRFAEKEIDKPAHVNMSYTDWENKPNSLLYLLHKTNRFSENNGIFICLYDDENMVAVSGCYKAEFDDVVIGGVRAWVLPKYRAKYLQANYLLKYQREWCIRQNCKAFILTFNDYNKKLMDILIRDGKYKEKATKGVGFSRPNFYNNFQKLERKVIIQHTEQWVLYEKFKEGEIKWIY